MKRFVKNILFSFLSILMLLFIIHIMALYLQEKELNNKDYIKDKNTIYAGDSHIQTSIIDSLLLSSINISNSGEALVYTYYKLKFLLSQQNSVKTIVLGLSYHNLSSSYDNLIYGEKAAYIAPNYFLVMPLASILNIIKNAKSDNKDVFMKNYASMNIGKVLYSDKRLTFIGNYKPNTTTKTANVEETDKQIIRQYYDEYGNLKNHSVLQIKYLDSIVKMCNDNNIQLIILKTPMSKFYRDKIPVEYKNMYNEEIKSRKIKIIDLSDIISEDEYFLPDGDHVNQKGALIVTKQLKEKIH